MIGQDMDMCYTGALVWLRMANISNQRLCTQHTRTRLHTTETRKHPQLLNYYKHTYYPSNSTISRYGRRRPFLSSVGRLDKDTSGLLILTDDGQLVHRINSPKRGIWKVSSTTSSTTTRRHGFSSSGVTVMGMSSAWRWGLGKWPA